MQNQNATRKGWCLGFLLAGTWTGCATGAAGGTAEATARAEGGALGIAADAAADAANDDASAAGREASAVDQGPGASDAGAQAEGGGGDPAQRTDSAVDGSPGLASSGDGASPDGTADDGAIAAGPAGCQPLALTSGATVDGSRADVYAWSDGACLPRTASLIRNDAPDAFNERGGYLRAISYQAAGKTRDIRGTGSNGWQGFGYIVDHMTNGGAFINQQVGGTYRTVLAGRHHAIHEFQLDVSVGGTVHATVHWMFATGRSHPLFAITLDSSANPAGAVQADTRSPYGDLAWDDGVFGAVSGDGWGDTHKFTTTGPGPVTTTSPWDYTQPNTIPYDYEWSNATDAEMGLVSTLSWASRIAGGDYYGGDLANKWGHTGQNLLVDLPPAEWPFQLNQYELPFVTTSHRICWGATFGAVGAASYTAFGQSLSGYPYQSYTVYVVLGTHGASAVAAQVAAVEAEQSVTLTAARGAVATSGPGGPGRTDATAFPRPGFDPVYAAWTLDADANAATARVDTGGAVLVNPIFEVRGYTAASPPASVTFGGRALVADTDYFATVDPAGRRLWLTLNATLRGASTLDIH